MLRTLKIVPVLALCRSCRTRGPTGPIRDNSGRQSSSN